MDIATREEPRQELAWRLKKKRKKGLEGQEDKEEVVVTGEGNAMGDAGGVMSAR
jgi:hypothetical protein